MGFIQYIIHNKDTKDCVVAGHNIHAEKSKKNKCNLPANCKQFKHAKNIP